MEVYILLLVGVCITIIAMDWVIKHRKFVFDKHQINFINDGSIVGFVVFVILATFSAVRDGIGIDYSSYIMHIENIQRGYDNYMEIGFQTLVNIVKYVDDNPRLALIVIAVVTCYFFVKGIWEQSVDPLVSIFVFLTWGYYFFTFNTVRNYFALAIILYASKYMLEKKYVKFIIAVLIASTFHKTALVCIPIYFLANRKYKSKDIFYVAGIVVALIALKNYIRPLIFYFYPAYLGSVYDTGRISYLNVIKAVVVIGLCALYWKNIKDDNASRFYFNLNVLSLVYYVGLYWIPEVSRIGFYMNISSLLLIPRVLSSIKDKQSKYIAKLLFYVGSMVLFVLLMRTFYYPTMMLLPYDTWLFNGSY